MVFAVSQGVLPKNGRKGAIRNTRNCGHETIFCCSILEYVVRHSANASCTCDLARTSGPTQTGRLRCRALTHAGQLLGLTGLERHDQPLHDQHCRQLRHNGGLNGQWEIWLMPAVARPRPRRGEVVVLKQPL